MDVAYTCCEIAQTEVCALRPENAKFAASDPIRSCLGTAAEPPSITRNHIKWPIERISKGAVQHSCVLKSEPIVTGRPTGSSPVVAGIVTLCE
jgi:hypothetical protein